MDFILKKIENKLSLNDPGSYDYITLLRARIEYCLFQCLGYVWKNLEGISQEKRDKIFTDLNNLSIGSAVSAIRDLDISNEILTNKKSRQLLDHYPYIRNRKMGHGYDMANDIASSLTPLYNDLIQFIPFLKTDCDIIIVKSYDPVTSIYKGIRLPFNQNGEGVRWSCPAESFGNTEDAFPRTYISFDNKYYKLSPFIVVDESRMEPYIFSSLTEKIVGKTKMCPLFGGDSNPVTNEIIFKELVCLYEEDNYRIYSKSNGTIMNNFILNYSQYIEVGFRNLVMTFLNKNRAYVTATIWGHGGVGKTACIQKVCYDLFNNTEKRFSYIVFVTAKDRIYNVKTGKIGPSERSLTAYSEIIETISRTVFDCHESLRDDSEKLSEYENKISDFADKLLIVIDDYETFEDSEKEKISVFLNSLNAQYHKVIITTRNNRFVIGEALPSNEFNTMLTKSFIEEVVKTDYREHLDSIERVLSDHTILDHIQKATSGRPIFIYQFIHLFVQKGYREDLIKGIRTSQDAQEFLYGRIFKYLSKNAQYLFATISILVDNDLRFKFDVLEYVLGKVIPEKDQFEASIDEVINQKVIERNNDVYGRVYSAELLQIMTDRYEEYPQDFRDTVRNLLNNIGGKDIEGDILEAMLTQADKSRAFGNEKETVEKYRRVLNNSKCPDNLRKNALKRLSDYLSNSRLNPVAAISVIEEYLRFFKHDSDIYTLYVYLLWSQEVPEKEKAVNIIWEFFRKGSHKKTSNEFLTFFALGTGYCINFDVQYRKYYEEKLRKQQYSATLNEYGKELFDFIKHNPFMKGKAGLFHNVRVALIQTLKLCYYLGKYEKSKAKVEYGLEICDWLRQSGLKEPFLTQVNRWQDELEKILRDRPTAKDIGVLEIFQPEEIYEAENKDEDIDSFLSKNGRHFVGDIINVKILRIMPYGAIAGIDESIKGLIHISEIAYRYIEDIKAEFKVGEICPAKINTIDHVKKSISLSTKGLGKFK